jgi:alpha-L-fucosidase
MKYRSTALFLFLAILFLQSPIYAQATYQPAPENLEARQWFQDAKFGMFIHWGVYSVLGDGEWVMNNRRIPIKDYEKLPSFFNPTEFNAAEWVALAKAAGMKYITITSKHHDGFAMYDSKVSDYDIVDHTPYKKDVLKMMAEECRKQGIKLFFYHSHLDWHHSEYFPRGKTGQEYTGRPESGDFNKYLDYMDTQLTELLTNYGPIGGIWFDGWWDQAKEEMNKSHRDTKIDWRLGKTYSLIHKLQPACMIGNNHHVAPFDGEDFQMFERDLPGQNTFGYNTTEIGKLPLEMCETMNGSWGFNIKDENYKSTKRLVQLLVTNAGSNSNFLLNIGPMPNGKIQPEFAKTLQEIGEWTKTYGETVYGTRGGPVSPRDWGVTTQKGNKVYVHVLNWKDNVLAMPAFGKKIKSAKLFSDKSKVSFTQNADGIVLTLPKADPKAYDTILELEI